MIKETSWLFVLLTPSRWLEAYHYFFDVSKANIIGAYDRPDPRDLDAKQHPFAGAVKISKEFYLDEKAEKLGWKAKKQSLNSCTAYSKGGSVAVTNTLEHQKPVEIDEEVLWKHQEETGADRAYGDSVQNADKQFHKFPQGFPQTEYRRLRFYEDTIRGVKVWLLKNETVRSGIYWKWVDAERNTNSGYAMKTGFLIGGNGTILGGHAMYFAGWNDKMVCPDGSVGAFKMRESELMEWGDNPKGVMWLPYNQFENMFSKYVSRDCLSVVDNESVDNS